VTLLSARIIVSFKDRGKTIDGLVPGCRVNQESLEKNRLWQVSDPFAHR
jgi:hypothetical protein